MGRRNNGEGAIRQKRKNLWEGRIVIGHKNDGSSIFKYVYAKNKKEAEQAVAKLAYSTLCNEISE